MLLHNLIFNKGEMLEDDHIKEIYGMYLKFKNEKEFMIEGGEFVECIILSLLIKKKNFIIELM